MPSASDLAVAFTTRSGRVESFDEHRGTGAVVDGEDGRRWPFHCTRIADGSRTIAAGATVSYQVVPGPTGLEAVALEPPGGRSA